MDTPFIIQTPRLNVSRFQYNQRWALFSISIMLFAIGGVPGQLLGQGRIVTMGGDLQVPLIDVKVAGGRTYPFVLALESVGVVVYEDTLAGAEILRSTGSGAGVDDVLAPLPKQMAVDGKRFSTDLITRGSSPLKSRASRLRSRAKDPVDIERIAGGVGLRVLPHTTVEFRIREGQINLGEKEYDNPFSFAVDLYDSAKGNYVIPIPVGDSPWLFCLSTSETSAIVPFVKDLGSRYKRHGEEAVHYLGKYFDVKAKLRRGTENRASIFALSSDTIVLDRKAMKLFIVKKD